MNPTRLFTVEHAITTYHHMVAPGVSLEDVLKPGYWAHVVPQLKAHTRIVCDTEDAAWTAVLYVRATTQVEAFVAVLSHVVLRKAQKPASKGDYSVAFRGPKSQWSVTLADGTVVREGLALEEHANAWIHRSSPVRDVSRV